MQWGGVLASRRYADDRGDNQVAGPDVNWQIDDTWRLRGQWLASSTSALADGQGALMHGASRSGQRRVLKLLRNSEDGESNIGIDEITADFRHDSGFVPQSGVRILSAFHSKAWRPLGPFNEFFLNLQLERQTELASGQVVKQDIRPGLYSNAARNLEWWLELHPQSLVRTHRGGPLLHERYVQSGLVMTPAPWFPLVDANVAVGRLADTAADRVRDGVRLSVTTKLRPLRPLELELQTSQAWLERDGRRTYGESASQLLAVWHFDGRQTLRAIVQRTKLDRRVEPGVAAYQGAGNNATLTYTWRRSAGTVVYVGASRSGDGKPTSQRASEAFVKLQFDTDDWRALL